MARLEEVVEKTTGTRNPTKLPNDNFIYVDVASVDNTEKTIVGARSILGADAPSRARKLIHTGDILISTVRPNLNAVALVQADLDGQVASTGFCVLRATTKVLPEYLFYFVISHKFVDGLSALVAGAMYPAVSDTQVLAQSLPVPSIAEQRRIIDILSRAEGIVKLRREAEKKSAELIPALFLDMFGDPTTNPKGWPVFSLGEHVEIVSAVKTPDLSYDADLPCIGADSIEGHTGKLISLPTVRDVRPISGKYRFKFGDVLYSKIRPYLAKVSLAPCVGYCSADMYPLSCKPSLRANFLLELLLSKSFTEYATAESVRAQMPKLNRQTLFAYKLPVPTIMIQEQFSDRANAVYSIQSQQSAATATAKATFDALLAQVFAG